MIYTVKIYRYDRRCKSGERFVNSYDFDRKDNAAMDREVNALRGAGYFDDRACDQPERGSDSGPTGFAPGATAGPFPEDGAQQWPEDPTHRRPPKTQ